MIQIAIAALSLALVITLFALRRVSVNANDAIGMAASLATEIGKLKTRVTDCERQIGEAQALLNKAQELIDAAKDAAEEEAKAAKAAQDTERRLQEGINSILNYSSQSYGADK